MPDKQIEDGRSGEILAAVSKAMVALHKEQFGRGPTVARSHFAGGDTLVCTLEDALHAAERAMVDMGQQERVSETRVFFQGATRARFIATVEELVGRKVRSFASATDPEAGVVYEVFTFVSGDGATGPAAG